MKRNWRIGNVYLLVAAAVSGLAIPSVSLAGDYKHKDFSLRFPAAMTRFSTYGDVAGVGGASAGSRWSSSINPAATAWLDVEGPMQMCASGQYAEVSFGCGLEVGVFAESLTVDADKYGTFLVAAGQIKSDQATMKSGFEYYWAGDMLQLQWAKKFSDDWALGFAFSYTKSVVRNKLGTVPIAKSNSDSYVVRAGALRKITDKWLAGIVVDYGWSRDRTCWYAIPAWGIAESHTYDRTRQILVRPGVSWEYMKDGTVYLDYQFGTFWNDTGRLNVHRIYGGIEQGFFEWVYPRVGFTWDPARGSWAYTCGMGFYPTKWLSVDVAYQYDMFPELSEDFGRAHVFNVSVSLTF